MAHIRKGDTVLVLSGKDKGKVDSVLEVITNECADEVKVRVKGVNMVTKHKKGNAENPAGSKVSTEGEIFASKVMLFCTKCKKPTRIAHKRVDDKNIRVCKHCGEQFKG
jgi:large subunit ribosomal protein L24